MATWKPRTRKKQGPRVKAQAGTPKAPVALLVALGAPPSGDEIPLMVSARANALDALGFDLKPAQLVEATRRAAAQADTVRLTVLKNGAEKPACIKGCSHCCSHKVGVTVPEVVAIVEYLRTLPGQLDVVRKKAALLAQNPLIFSDSEKPRARISCALLHDDGSCSVYGVRPLPCRSWLSVDVESCKLHLDEQAEPRLVLAAARTGRAIQLGLVKVMDDLGRRPYLVELTAALDIALNVPNAIDAWLAGEPTFERASAARR
jgi:Putative zinc- or iron-chelating domain